MRKRRAVGEVPNRKRQKREEHDEQWRSPGQRHRGTVLEEGDEEDDEEEGVDSIANAVRARERQAVGECKPCHARAAVEMLCAVQMSDTFTPSLCVGLAPQVRELTTLLLRTARIAAEDAPSAAQAASASVILVGQRGSGKSLVRVLQRPDRRESEVTR